MNAAGPQLYLISGAATSIGVRAGMATISGVSLLFYLIGKFQQHIAVRQLKAAAATPDKSVAAEARADRTGLRRRRASSSTSSPWATSRRSPPRTTACCCSVISCVPATRTRPTGASNRAWWPPPLRRPSTPRTPFAAATPDYSADPSATPSSAVRIAVPGALRTPPPSPPAMTAPAMRQQRWPQQRSPHQQSPHQRWRHQRSPHQRSPHQR